MYHSLATITVKIKKIICNFRLVALDERKKRRIAQGIEGFGKEISEH